MIALLLGLLLSQVAPQGTGFVTGVVRASNGSPAARIRVYAITYRDAVEAATLPPALESLTETDESGRYRLELQPGRYTIATGSVAAPTYYPGTSDITAARVITVARDLVVSDIDFGTFIPASRNVNGIAVRPAGNGVLSGVLRYPDGTPASGIAVVATPVSGAGPGVSIITTTPGGIPTINATAIGTVLNSAAAQLTQTITLILRQGNASTQAVTDASGAYQIQNLGPDAYHIVAGYAEAPTFYPGVPDAPAAKTVTVALNSKIDKLDFTVQVPSGVTVNGVVSTTGGIPATGATVRIRNLDNPSRFGLPVRGGPQTTNASGDGSFSFSNVQPGGVVIDVSHPQIPNQRREVVVSGQQASGLLQVVLPLTRMSGRILMEDGSPVSSPEVFGEVMLSPVRNPNIASTILPISGTGTFSRLMGVDEFRFYLRTSPEEYEIKSVKSGPLDLMNESLKISGNELVDVEIRVARRARVPGAGRVSGTVRDGITGMPAVGRITLCCAPAGIAEEFSAPLDTDGSFEFSALPPGKYASHLPVPAGTPWIYVVGPEIEVTSQGRQQVALFTAAQFGQITATIRSDDPLPENVLPSIAFVNPASGLRVIAERNPAGAYVAMLPVGVRYNVSVENLPAGFVVQSLPDPVELETASPVSVTIGRAAMRR
jgi:plasmid stabilization system protein ParE